MTFFVDGQFVAASYVSGISPDPFDERAKEATEGRVDQILMAAMRGL